MDVVGLLRLAAQKESAKTNTCLLWRMNCMSFDHKNNYTRKGTICKYFFAVEKAEKKSKLKIKMINKNLKIEGKSGFLGFILRGDVGFWVKNEGWGG